MIRFISIYYLTIFGIAASAVFISANENSVGRKIDLIESVSTSKEISGCVIDLSFSKRESGNMGKQRIPNE